MGENDGGRSYDLGEVKAAAAHGSRMRLGDGQAFPFDSGRCSGEPGEQTRRGTSPSQIGPPFVTTADIGVCGGSQLPWVKLLSVVIKRCTLSVLKLDVRTRGCEVAESPASEPANTPPLDARGKLPLLTGLALELRPRFARRRTVSSMSEICEDSAIASRQPSEGDKGNERERASSLAERGGDSPGGDALRRPLAESQVVLGDCG